jgi:hypothetical protein
MEKRKFLALLGLEPRPLCRPARSQLLYRLRYPGSYKGWCTYRKTSSVLVCVSEREARENDGRGGRKRTSWETWRTFYLLETKYRVFRGFPFLARSFF